MEDIIDVEIGSHSTVIIEKVFGPLVMTDLRVTIDPLQGEYIIERRKMFPLGDKEEWDVVARISGCVEDEV